MKKTQSHVRAHSDHDYSSLLAVADSSPQKVLPGLPIPGRSSIVVIPLSGVASIGMNWTLYGFDGRYILVDAGSGFAPRDVDGVEAVFPNPDILRSLGARLAGLVVTHFHEDHVGAIHRIFPDYATCDIHAPPFASEMLKLRFREADTLGEVRIRTFHPGSEIKVGPFTIRTVPVAHSTPDSVALLISCKAGSILHTGDWKLDPNPGVGYSTDMRKFAEIGNAGVDLMLCDSTNADRDSPQTTEATVRTAFAEIFRRTKGMVVISSFGSNVARMASVAQAAKDTGRLVALAGHSLRRAEEVATKLNLLGDVRQFLAHPRHLTGLDRNRQVLLCTGTQGEENAALTRIARGMALNLPEVRPGDVVVHSARVIPGNEDYVYEVFDALRASGAEIITAGDKFNGHSVHVTGHPCRSELRDMYDAVRPRCAIPVHGSPSHLKAHAELARENGVTDVTIPENGAVYELSNGHVTALGRLTQHYVAVLADDEGTLVRWDDERQVAVLEDRHETPAKASKSTLPASQPDFRRDRHPRAQRPDQRDPQGNAVATHIARTERNGKAIPVTQPAAPKVSASRPQPARPVKSDNRHGHAKPQAASAQTKAHVRPQPHVRSVPKTEPKRDTDVRTDGHKLMTEVVFLKSRRRTEDASRSERVLTHT